MFRLFTAPFVFPAALFCAALMVTTARADLPLQLRLQSVSASSGLYLDRWAGTGEGNGLGWKLRDNHINRPQTNLSGSLGAGVALARRTSLQVGVGFFHSRLESLREAGTGDSYPEQTKTGVGDFEIGLRQGWSRLQFGTKLVIPGPYDPEYEEPWAGMGVWRLGLDAGAGWERYYGYASGEFVVAETDDGMALAGDFLWKAGANAKFAATPLLTLKPGVDVGYSSVRWVAGVDPLNLFSVDPKLTVVVARHWKRSLAFTLGGTVYSHQSGEGFLNVYAPRKLFLGMGASLYL